MPVQYQLYLQFCIYYIHILTCLVVKIFLQDILICCDLQSKGQDLVPFQPFTGLPACILHLLCLVGWHYRFHHCKTLLPLLILGLLQADEDILCGWKFFFPCIALYLQKCSSLETFWQNGQNLHN